MNRLVLIGLRGSGKTALGRALAGGSLVDLDELVAARAGLASAAAFIRERGIEAFRRAEADALRDALAGDAAVIALGGGTPTAPGAAEMLRGCAARVVYLRATPETLAARLSRTDLASRPSLTGVGVLEEIGALFAARDGLYRGLAGEVIDVDSLAADEVLARLRAVQASA